MKKKGNFILIINLMFTLIVFGYFVLNILIMYNILSLDEFAKKMALVGGALISFICLLLAFLMYSNKKFEDKLAKIKSEEPTTVVTPIIEEKVIEEIIEEPVIEQAVEETKVTEEVEPITEESSNIEEALDEPEVEDVIEEENNIISIDFSKIKYEGKLMYAPMNVKEQYSIIKNHLLSYTGVTSRISSNKETFRKSGMLAQIRLVNNKLYVYLNVIPEPFISEGYKVKNVGDTKQYEETPTLIKITNDKSIKQFVDILDIMMTSKEINRKQRFKEVNYVDYLYLNGETILNGIGLSSEYLVNTINPKIISKDLPDNLLDYASTVSGEPLSEEVYKTTLYLDSLCTYFNDGDIINKDVLLAKKLIKKDDFVVIKGRGTLDKKFIIHADDFDEVAVKMIYLINGTVVLIKH